MNITVQATSLHIFYMLNSFIRVFFHMEIFKHLNVGKCYDNGRIVICI